MPDKKKHGFCKEVEILPVLPGFVTSELFRYCKDIRHATKGELGEISFETQAQIANALKGMFDPTDLTYGKPFTPSIPVPIGKLGLPGDLTLKIWPKDIKDLRKGPDQVVLQYELLRW